MTDELYYFEVLPLHPQPRQLETCTSWLTNTAEANRIQSIGTLSKLLFPDRDSRSTRTYSDFPPLRLTYLSRATLCPESRFLETTFFYLGKKFGRSTLPEAIGKFLLGIVANQFRYCPECIAAKGYYSLKWRFNYVKSCPEHRCYLLDRCESCGATIPFLAPSLKIGMCTKCGFNLGQSNSTISSQAEQLSSISQAEQLEFLLRPQPFEENARQLMERLGLILTNFRLEAGKTRLDLVEELNMSFSMLSAIENGIVQPYGASFASYKKYIDHFGLSFTDLFKQATEYTASRKYIWTDKKQLMINVQKAIQDLEKNQKEVTRNAVSALVGVSVSTMKHHGATTAIALYKEKRRNDFKARVQETVNELMRQGSPITLPNVAEALGVSQSYLEYRPAVMAIIREAREKYKETSGSTNEIGRINMCPNCQAITRQVKSGFNPSGTQRFRCHHCGRIYTPAREWNRYPESIFHQVIHLYLEGMSRRSIARKLGLSPTTVNKWVKVYESNLPLRLQDNHPN